MFGVLGSIANDGSAQRALNHQLENLRMEEMSVRCAINIAQQEAAKRGEEFDSSYGQGYLNGLQKAKEMITGK